MADADQSNLTMLTVDLLSAYVANNSVQHGDLSELIKSTHAALKIIDSPEEPAPAEPEHKAAVTVRKSLASATHIISMIDGKPYQTLKRHLAKHGLTPQEYRERYSLPRDYPMVAKAYSESRRAIAERLGLGRKAGTAKAPTAETTKTSAEQPTKALKAKMAAPKTAAGKVKTETPNKSAKAPTKRAAGVRSKTQPTPAPVSAAAVKGAQRKRVKASTEG